MNEKALTALIFVVAGLLALVVVVGLAQRILDATGVAVALTGALSGLVAGAVLRSKNSDKDGKGGDS